VSHWAWDSSGWLNQLNYMDFAGSGVVHLLGGVCALVACATVGARLGRFDEDGNPHNMPGHSVPLTALGGFILLFGFLAFNGGSQGAIASAGDAENVSTAIVSTILGGSAGGIVVLFINKFMCGFTWSYLFTLNGTLAGMVAQCSGCNVYQPWAAVVVGVIGGLAFLAVHFLMLKYNYSMSYDFAISTLCTISGANWTTPWTLWLYTAVPALSVSSWLPSLPTT
jgi:Amt family ammonium transporter